MQIVLGCNVQRGAAADIGHAQVAALHSRDRKYELVYTQAKEEGEKGPAKYSDPILLINGCIAPF
jgi:hypothetical protein